MNESRQYNGLLQLTQMTATNGSTLMNTQYNYSATQNNGRITSSNDYVTGENVSYTYDAVNRLTGASAGSMWGETYSYDGFGNLTGKNVTQAPAPTLGVSYDANNHQVGLTYDANGNQSMDAQGATYYQWNVENRLALAWQWGGLEASTWYSYDPWGRRVMKDVNLDPGDNGYMGGAWEFYFYGITGQKLATVSCSYLGSQPNCYMRPYNVYFGGKLVMTTDMGAVVTDRLGSVRNSGGVGYSYFPYGEERTVTADGTEKFGTYYSDAAGQDYAQQRYYNSGTGRFWSPDPAGLSRANPADPASLNMYSYVRGDPVNRNDPTGLCTLMVGGWTASPSDSPAFSGQATALGADSAYPFSGLGHWGSLTSQISGSDAPVALNALQYALNSNSGLIDIIAYSGGAAAFTAAYNQLTPAQQARIGLVLYVSPGAAGTLANVNGTTEVVWGSGGLDTVATLPTSVGVTVPIYQAQGCNHRDFACLIGSQAAQAFVAQMSANGGCNSPAVYTRNSITIAPTAAASGGVGGIGATGGGDLEGYWDYMWLLSTGIADVPFKYSTTETITYLIEQ